MVLLYQGLSDFILNPEIIPLDKKEVIFLLYLMVLKGSK